MTKVTIKEIAEATGLSWQAVSQVLNNKGRISPKTRERVWAAARRLGYRPNAAARAIGSGRFGCAALVASDDTGRSSLPIGLLYGLQEGLSRHNMHLAVTRLPDAELTDQGFVPKVLRESMADGMFVNYTHAIPARMLELIHEHHAPAIWLNTQLDADCVYPDDLAGSQDLTRRLLRLGHRRIGYLKFDFSDHYSQKDRRQGYELAMQEAGCAARVVDRDVPGSEQYELVRMMLSASDRPTAVIVRPEEAALVLSMAQHLGLRVPADLSVTAIAGDIVCAQGHAITAAIVPAEQEGIEAVDMLLAKLESPGALQVPRAVPFLWHEGTSCGAAPQS